MRAPFIIDPEAEGSDLSNGLGELMSQSHALINHICANENKFSTDGVSAQLLWTLNTMIDQAKEITDKLEM